MLAVAIENPRQSEAVELLRQSDAHFTSIYPVESCHLVSADFLSAPNVRFVMARLDGRALGCGALVMGAGRQGELKRMFVTASARGQGAGKAVLEALEAEGRRTGVRLVQLETGILAREAISLYLRFGYVRRGPFAQYPLDPNTLFMEKAL